MYSTKHRIRGALFFALYANAEVTNPVLKLTKKETIDETV